MRQFTKSWFMIRNLSTFERLVAPAWAGKPVHYLEIGVFEGMSLAWMLAHVLTHPESRAVGVDPWVAMPPKHTQDEMDQVKARANANVQPWAGKVRLIRSNSCDALRAMLDGWLDRGPGTFDLAMVDGCHNALAVLDDARQVARLLKPGGWLLFDDVVNGRRRKDHVRAGVDLFKKEFPGFRLLWADNHVEAYCKD